MRTSIVILGIAIVAGLSVLTVESKFFISRSPDPAALPSPSAIASNSSEVARPRSAMPDTADNRREIKARYLSAATISSAVERDNEYGTLAGYAAAGGDFGLALEIADHVSAAAVRDVSYARIVHQAMSVGDFAAADKAAGKISSVMLRDEQFKKIAQSCPSNTMTEGTASVPDLESGNRAGALTRSDRAAGVHQP
jgi:hypothetical protein